MHAQSSAKKIILKTDELERAAMVINAINHRRRQSILKFIRQNQPVIVTDIYKKLKLKQSITSQNLSVLRKTGFVVAERKQRNIFYSVNHSKFEELEAVLSKMLH
jgi:DNA-binding transcriptional ArsR family regulator